jgi:hypothetical protein
MKMMTKLAPKEPELVLMAFEKWKSGKVDQGKGTSVGG